MATVRNFARVICRSNALWRTGSRGGRDRPGEDTTEVIRRVCGIGGTFYQALIMVVPSRLTSMMATSFLVVVRVRRLAVSQPVHVWERRYASSSPSYDSSGFKHPLALMKGCLQCFKEWLAFLELRPCPLFSRRTSTQVGGKRRSLQRRRSSVMNETLKASLNAE